MIVKEGERIMKKEIRYCHNSDGISFKNNNVIHYNMNKSSNAKRIERAQKSIDNTITPVIRRFGNKVKRRFFR